MQKRNFILLIIVLVVVVGALFGYLYLTRNTVPGVESEGTNFISRFNPFGVKNNNPDSTKPIPEYPPGGEDPETPAETLKLSRVSSMPVAGYTVFSKERLKELPKTVPSEEAAASTDATASAETTPTKPKTTKPTPPPTEFATALRYIDRAT